MKVELVHTKNEYQGEIHYFSKYQKFLKKEKCSVIFLFSINTGVVNFMFPFSYYDTLSSSLAPSKIFKSKCRFHRYGENDIDHMVTNVVWLLMTTPVHLCLTYPPISICAVHDLYRCKNAEYKLFVKINVIFL